MAHHTPLQDIRLYLTVQYWIFPTVRSVSTEFLEIEWWLYFCTGKNVGVRDDTPDPLQDDDDDVCCVGPLLQHNSTSYGVVLVSYNSFIHSESHSLIGGV